MAKKSVFNSDAPAVADVNMTPMIDVTFQLILFFILVGQVASDALAVMILPDPNESPALPTDKVIDPDSMRIILNIVSRSKSTDDLGTERDPEGSRVGFYQLGTKTIDVDSRNPGVALAELKATVEELLKDLTDDQKDAFAIEIRADRRLRYDEVAPAMFTVSGAGLTNMQITALQDLEK